MFRKTATVIGALLLLGSVGCQTQLDRVWTYGEFEDHAMKLDSEVAEFHSDVKENFFGISPQAERPVWFTYRR